MSIEDKNMTHAQKTYLIQSNKSQNKEWDNQLPKESKVPTNKPNPLHFLWWHKVPKLKGLSSTNTQDRNLIPIEKDLISIEDN